MDRPTVVAVFVVAFLSIAAAAGAQDDANSRFQLFTGCSPTRVVVTLAPGDVDVTLSRVENLVESRLRAARVYADPEDSWLGVLLSVNVGFSGDAYSTQVLFFKQVTDPFSGEQGVAATWEGRRLGTHAGDGSFVMQNVSELVDRFVLEYLRVNEGACGNP